MYPLLCRLRLCRTHKYKSTVFLTAVKITENQNTISAEVSLCVIALIRTTVGSPSRRVAFYGPGRSITVTELQYNSHQADFIPAPATLSKLKSLATCQLT